MEHYYLFLIITTEFMSLEFVVSEDSTENITYHMLMGNSVVRITGLLQNAGYLDPSSKCTLIATPCDQSAGIAADYTVS